ncbi:DUF4136 domain-containing protein [Pseudoalteromonas sp. NEC-BIFX-2020_002]|uniref:DUF4136 domain-containing protein n=1 Tax=Pseudoalteromonas sp. NEC-BIFX-2020_002 TaxID=2732353 RepID=UPI0014775824|nr:DUF4136 domain-containing protein [Pseudoalteromonas sp. NEC-BIFX-2020_002]NNG42792.1 DUF4136 domain-containing protein [Pseudoalteromonas sp. NEC-BIFX-2020_002]
MKNLLIATAVLFLAACAKTPDWDYDKSADFSNYKTFAWVQDASLTKNTTNYQISPLMEKRVRDAVNTELTNMGMQLSEITQADVLINYHASVGTKIDVDTFNTGYSARWNYWGMGYNTQTTTREYEVGTLIVDVVDRASNQLVWRGAKEGRLRKNQSPEARTDAITKTVADILSNFPPDKQ